VLPHKPTKQTTGINTMLSNYKGNSAYKAMVKREARQLLAIKLCAGALFVAGSSALIALLYTGLITFLSLSL
jgi:hypothetical protein